jgi:hypothetical protein
MCHTLNSNSSFTPSKAIPLVIFRFARLPLHILPLPLFGLPSLLLLFSPLLGLPSFNSYPRSTTIIATFFYISHPARPYFFVELRLHQPHSLVTSFASCSFNSITHDLPLPFYFSVADCYTLARRNFVSSLIIRLTKSVFANY